MFFCFCPISLEFFFERHKIKWKCICTFYVAPLNKMKWRRKNIENSIYQESSTFKSTVMRLTTVSFSHEVPIQITTVNRGEQNQKKRKNAEAEKYPRYCLFAHVNELKGTNVFSQVSISIFTRFFFHFFGGDECCQLNKISIYEIRQTVTKKMKSMWS